MEQLFFVLLVAVVGVVRLVSQLAEKKKNEEAAKRTTHPAPERPSVTTPQQAPAGSEEERIRKFMEALGMPSALPSPPPAQLRPSRGEQPSRRRTLRPVDPFPRPRLGTPLATPPPLPEAIAPKSAPAPISIKQPVQLTRAPQRSAAPDFQVQEIDQILVEDVPAAGSVGSFVSCSASLAARLATRGGLRDAIVLTEIFGPPRSVQSLDRTAGA